MKAEKLLKMIYILLGQPQLSAPALADKLEVSVRTVYRYVETLSAAGFPVYATRGRNGGIALMDQFKLTSTMVDRQEQANILAALQSLRTLHVDDGVTLDKLAAIFQQAPVAWLKIDPTVWQPNEDQTANLSLLKTAILQGQFVQFNYLNAANDYRQRQVYPYQVLFKDHAWYLQAYAVDRRAMRLFKLTRIDELVLSSAPHDMPERPWLTAQAEPVPMPKKIAVVLTVDARLKYRVREEFRQADVAVQSNGQFLIHCLLSDSDWLITYLLSFGAGLRVIAPLSVKARLKSELQKMLANY